MIEELVVHIGTHKTGTTAIQSALSRSHTLLLEKGILYPETGRGHFGSPRSMQRFPGHANLARQAIRSRAFDPREGGMNEVVVEAKKSGAQRIILSAEDFSAPAGQKHALAWTRRLSEQVGAKSTRIVIFLRPQWEYLESRYAQQVKGGLTQARFPRFVDLDIDHERYDYLKMVESWEDLGSITLVGYGGGITRSAIDDFAERLLPEGIPLEIPPHRPNQRGGERMVEMLRVLRGSLMAAGLGQDRAEMFYRARQRLSTELVRDPPWHGLTTRVARRIWSHHLSRNTELVGRFGAESTLGHLIEPPDQLPPRSAWTLADASEDEVELYTSLLRDILHSGERSRSAHRTPDTMTHDPAQESDRRHVTNISELLNKGTFSVRSTAEHPSQRTAIVIGNPRGGTSMVAGVLQRIGVPTGGGLVFEDSALGKAFDEGEDALFRDLIAQRNSEHDIWGWKRPSSYKRLDFVDESFRNPYYVAVFRDPLAVALRENISMKMGAMKALRRALRAYTEIVAFIDASSRPFLCVSYDKALRYPEEFVRALGEFFGVSVDERIDEALRFIDPEPEGYLKKSHRRGGQAQRP